MNEDIKFNVGCLKSHKFNFDYCLDELLNNFDYLQKQLEAYENMRKEEIDYLHNLKNFKIKYNKKSATNPIEEELFASDKDFIKDLLNILNKVGGSDE